MNAIFLQVVTGLQLGAIYALIALGLTLIFGTLGVVNFAHGALYMLAAYVAIVITQEFGFVAALVFTPILLFGVGLVMERGLIRFFYDRPHTDQILVTFGLAIVAEELLKWYFGANATPFPLPAWASGPMLFHGLGVTVPEAIQAVRFPIPIPGLDGFVFYQTWRMVLIAVTLVVVLALFAMLRFTRFGLVVRAGMRDPDMLRFLGVNITQRFTLVFGIGALIAGIAGAFHGPLTAVSPVLGMTFLVPSFLVVVIGGMGSMVGALLSAVLIGMCLSFTAEYSALQQIVVYLLAVVVLLVRPRGLLGQKGVFE